MKKLLLIGVMAFALKTNAQNNLITQRTCGTAILPQQYETWVQGLTPPQQANGKGSGQNSIQSIFYIPVIVHVIHNNEAVNSNIATSGANLSAAQIQDQINILNKDFNGLNPDTNLIPAVFKPLLGKFQVHFCLAVVNPTGGVIAEPGIDRINRVAKGWTAPPYSMAYVDATVKPNSIWDPNRYLNMWACGMSGGILGYATFPNPGASGLQGLTGTFGTATSDGVVILNTAFGSIGTAASGQYNKGRTATHEVGHWIGLRHIWGDGTCATDYCNDTPPAQTANYSCPSFPYHVGTCAGNTTGEMTMNFMDYTDDACMYMFTADQKNRAQLILTNSPMRAALITSTVCNAPAIGNDVGISFVSSPTYSQVVNCINFINPIINLTNYGTTPLTSALFSFNVNGVNTQTMSWTGNLAANASTTIALNQIGNLVNGNYTFSVNVTAPNGGTDNNLANNNNLQQFSVINIFTLTATSATICAGTTANLIASGASNYTWSVGGNNASVAVSPTASTIYTVSGGNGNCVTTRTTAVIVNPSPTLSVNNASICSGNSALITASGANSYTWSNGLNTSTISVSPTITTTYSVIGTNSIGCTSIKVSTITINQPPTLTAYNYTICQGGTATLSASGASSYTWNTGSNASSIVFAPTSNTTFVVSGSNGNCIDTKTVSLTIGGALSVYIMPNAPSVCKGSSITLTALGGNSYVWNTASTSNSITVSPTLLTHYTVTATSGNCTGTQTIAVFVYQLPSTVLTATNVSCFGGNNGSISLNTANGAAPYTYTYSSGSPNNLTIGNYSVITSDNNGCKSTSTISITQPAALTSAVSTSNTSCPAACNGVATYTFGGGTAPYTYILTPAGATNTTLCSGLHNYTVTDNNGCQTTSSFVINPGNAGISIVTSVVNLSCGSCNDGSLTATATSGTGPYTYNWMPSNANTSSISNLAEGCYTVTITDAQGCSNTASECVSFDTGILNQVLKTESINVLPNPNNGVFNLEFATSSDRQIEIINVLGQLIKSNTVITSTASIDISSFADGIYYAKVISENKLTVLKIVKN